MPKPPTEAQTIQPTTIRLEAMSVCQLRCPTCPTTSGAARPTVGSGYLRVGDFATLLEANPHLRHVELSNFGEILLSPDFTAILARAREYGVTVSADNGLNLNTATPEQLESMVRFGFRSATISIDGASQESYAQHRVRGAYDTVIANIRTLNAFKTQHASTFPRLAWQFVIFGHNEHELPVARKLAAELNMEFRPKLSYSDDFSPVQDAEFVRRQLSSHVASRKEYEEEFGEHYARRMCHQLWTEPQINWDGKVLGCCVNYWGEFGGNAFKDGLQAAINSDGMQYARRMLTGIAPARGDIPCSTCSVYQSMQAKENWLTAREVHASAPLLRTGMKQLYAASGVKRIIQRLARTAAHLEPK